MNVFVVMCMFAITAVANKACGVAAQMSACPNEWVHFKGSCYLFNDNDNIKKDWTEAKLHCASLNSDLVTIESKDEDVFLQGYSNKLFKSQATRASTAFWAGATDAATEGIWRTPTGSLLSYTNWAFGQPNVWKPNLLDEDCLCLFGYANFQWHDCHCGGKGPFICEFRLPRQCPDKWVYFEGSCYLFNDEPELNKDWTQAKQHCASLSSNLVTIESKAEDVFLQDYSNKLFKPPTNKPTAFWAGATDVATEGIWRTSTGSLLSYTNWDRGQPDTRVGNNEDCLCLFGYARFKWHDCHCGGKGPFICERLAE